MGNIWETPLGEQLQDALASGKSDDIAQAVGVILDVIWPRPLDSDQIQQVVEKLQQSTEFDHAVAVGDAAIATGRATIETRRRYAQALIEIGALHAAELEIRSILADETVSPKERGEALGLLGRLNKQRFIAGKRPADLSAAIAAYFEGYQGGTDPLWHGANLVALLKRAAQIEGTSWPPDVPGVDGLTTDLLALVRETPEIQRDIWTRATEVECLVATGDFEQARRVAQDLAKSRHVNSFELRSLRRQLIEVWELDPTDPVILAIDDRTLQLGQGATVEIAESPMQLEKILGTALPLGYNTLVKGLRTAELVCKITDANGEGWGTGFLVRGSLIHDSLGDDYILATNAHVISSTPGIGQMRDVEAQARFDVTKGVDGELLIITDLEEIWTSPPSRCDVTLLRIKTELPAFEQPIEAAPVLPPKTDGSYVYVIGHPAGAGLKFSIRGNDLLGYDDEAWKVHYTAPTEGGSSGSPVFSAAWQLMAVHHAGNEKMRSLEDPSKTYKANEGITLDSIRAEFEKDLANQPAG